MEHSISSLMDGIVDIHIHAGPSVASRSVDAVEMLRLAEAAKYRAIVIKDHYFPTVLGTAMLQKHLAAGGTQIYGGMCLNRATGGFNLNAIEAAIAMGSKIIWFPTISARQHQSRHKGKFVGAGSMAVADAPIDCLDESGRLTGEVRDVLRLMAQYPDVVLGTGHISPRELDQVIPAAFEYGVKKVLINHPHFIIYADPRDVARWCAMGACVEINGGIFQGVSESPATPNISRSYVKAYLDSIALDHIIIDSDSGQKGSPDPVQVLRRFLELLLSDGVSWEQIEQMAKVNPGRLIGLTEERGSGQ